MESQIAHKTKNLTDEKNAFVNDYGNLPGVLFLTLGGIAYWIHTQTQDLLTHQKGSFLDEFMKHCLQHVFNPRNMFDWLLLFPQNKRKNKQHSPKRKLRQLKLVIMRVTSGMP